MKSNTSHDDEGPDDLAEVDADEDYGPPAMSISGDPTGLPRHLARFTTADGQVRYISDVTTVNTLRAMDAGTIDTTCELRINCDGAVAVAEVSGKLACAACES